MKINKIIKISLAIFSVYLIATIIIAFFAVSAKNDNLSESTVEGCSMEPTLHDGDIIKYTFDKTPQIYDIVVYTCKKSFKSSTKCADYNLSDSTTLVKRIIKINESGCYWIEGDNKERSYDSRTFGWLCPNEIDSLGIVVNE